MQMQDVISEHGKELVDFVIVMDELSPEEASDAEYIDDRIQIHLEEASIREMFEKESE